MLGAAAPSHHLFLVHCSIASHTSWACNFHAAAPLPRISQNVNNPHGRVCFLSKFLISALVKRRLLQSPIRVQYPLEARQSIINWLDCSDLILFGRHFGNNSIENPIEPRATIQPNSSCYGPLDYCNHRQTTSLSIAQSHHQHHPDRQTDTHYSSNHIQQARYF